MNVTNGGQATFYRSRITELYEEAPMEKGDRFTFPG